MTRYFVKKQNFDPKCEQQKFIIKFYQRYHDTKKKLLFFVMVKKNAFIVLKTQNFTCISSIFKKNSENCS